MAVPLSADAYLRALRAEGLDVVEHGDWRNHNRNHKGQWGPVHGVMMHHTSAYSSEAQIIDYCRTGDRNLPGPLCQAVIDKRGRVHIVGYGRCNHAGGGDGDVLDAVIAERPAPVDDETGTDGNRAFYGAECINSGSEPWSDAQYQGMVRWAAAVCRAHGWGELSVIAHKEWQPGKPDPAGIDMAKFRRDVGARLGYQVPTVPPPPAPKPSPVPAPVAPPFPGRKYFRLGARNDFVTQADRQLIRLGFTRYHDGNGYQAGPSYTSYTLGNVRDFQRSQGWTGTDADGLIGPVTWARLHVVGR